jgi:hypothetical protein
MFGGRGGKGFGANFIKRASQQEKAVQEAE